MIVFRPEETADPSCTVNWVNPSHLLLQPGGEPTPVSRSRRNPMGGPSRSVPIQESSHWQQSEALASESLAKVNEQGSNCLCIVKGLEHREQDVKNESTGYHECTLQRAEKAREGHVILVCSNIVRRCNGTCEKQDFASYVREGRLSERIIELIMCGTMVQLSRTKSMPRGTRSLPDR